MGGLIVFRFKKSIPVGYDKQGYIYFKSLLYYELPEQEQKKILNCCLCSGGREYYQALFKFVTTNASATEICCKYHISESTLWRITGKDSVDLAKQI